MTNEQKKPPAVRTLDDGRRRITAGRPDEIEDWLKAWDEWGEDQFQKMSPEEQAETLKEREDRRKKKSHERRP